MFTNKMTVNLAQHAQGYVDGGQQGSERRRHVRVERRGGEAEHKQGSVFSQIYTLAEGKEREREKIIRVFIRI